MQMYKSKVRISKEIILSLILLTLPIITCTCIFYSPKIRSSFYLYLGNETLMTLYLSNFSHSDIEHLIGNLAYYFIFAILSFLLLWCAGEIRKFVYSSIILLISYPFLISVIWSLLNRFFIHFYGPSYGFSGVVGGYISLCIISAIHLLHVKFQARPSYLFIGFSFLLFYCIAYQLCGIGHVLTIVTISMSIIFIAYGSKPSKISLNYGHLSSK